MSWYVDYSGPVVKISCSDGVFVEHYPVLDTEKDAEFIRFLEHPDDFNLYDIVRLRKEYY